MTAQHDLKFQDGFVMNGYCHFELWEFSANVRVTCSTVRRFRPSAEYQTLFIDLSARRSHHLQRQAFEKATFDTLLGSVMTDQEIDPHRAVLALALVHLESALELLDKAGAPAQVGAHVDLAACRLRDLLGIDSAGHSPQFI